MAVIVAKYSENHTDFLLPIIKEQGNERRQYDNALHLVNYLLKELSKMLKLLRPLTIYVARHSWASVAKAKTFLCRSSAKEWDTTRRQRRKSTLHHWRHRWSI